MFFFLFRIAKYGKVDIVLTDIRHSQTRDILNKQPDIQKFVSTKSVYPNFMQVNVSKYVNVATKGEREKRQAKSQLNGRNYSRLKKGWRQRLAAKVIGQKSMEKTK